ncbi:MAG: hypothetical protein JXR83_22625 [Deltaproteobacteria bacterium]|nr:hypothetical protein [Deltaproteobacteria bacterium]
MATKLLTVVLLLGAALSAVAGCATEDDMIFIANNTQLDPKTQCDANPLLILSPGVLDVSDTYPVVPGDPSSTQIQSPRTYSAMFLVRTNAEENYSNTRVGRTTETVYNYGGLPTTDVLIEEVEVQYDFSLNSVQPSGATLDQIPAQLTMPANAWVGPKTKAGRTAGVEGTAFLGFDVVPGDIGAVLGADPDLYTSLNYPNSYLLATRIRARGRTTGGTRIQTEWTTFPLKLCRGCVVNVSACRDIGENCYPPWQDCVW